MEYAKKRYSADSKIYKELIMFNVDEVIGEKYKVLGLCNNTGGMGVILFVSDLLKKNDDKRLVLKYCLDLDGEQTKRFRREVRLLSGYKDNSKIIQLVDYDLDHEPPYFVMKYYEDGDLTKVIEKIRDSNEKQEKLFIEMIDCIAEIHAKNQYHRDIKPQNFLMDKGSVIVSDFGLSMEIESSTGLTKSSMYWGTHGYLPPEFLNKGGFKNADAAGDIFMLGKSFYVLLTGRDPVYLLSDGIDAPIFHVIDRACAINKQNRYQNLAELKQSLVMAYDVILKRGGGLGETQQLLSAISDKLEQEKKYNSKEVIAFIEKLSLLDRHDKIKICREIRKPLLFALSQIPVVQYLPMFLDVYQEMVESEDYGWSYAETIASEMNVIFTGEEVPNPQKAKALELAIDAAHRMNRFAAMDTCRSMICSVTDNALGLEVAAIILRNSHTFIDSIEPSACKTEAVRNAVESIKNKP